eukprot:11209581-Lingulodinium_polyedra.AAC.1
MAAEADAFLFTGAAPIAAARPVPPVAPDGTSTRMSRHIGDQIASFHKLRFGVPQKIPSSQ